MELPSARRLHRRASKIAVTEAGWQFWTQPAQADAAHTAVAAVAHTA